MTDLAQVRAEIEALRAQIDQRAATRAAIARITGLMPWRFEGDRVIHGTAFREHMEMVGDAPIEEQVEFDDLAGLRARWFGFIEGSADRRLEQVVPCRMPDGRPRWHYASLIALERIDGKIIRGIGGSVDITHLMTPLMQTRRQLEAQAEQLGEINTRLAYQTSQLKQANATLEEFAYAASHDLQAPLRAIAHFASWIEEDLPANCGKQVRGHVRGLQGRVKRMVALHADLLAYARIAGRRPEPTEVDLQRLVRSTWYHGEPPGGFELEADIPACMVHVAESSFRTVLRNLFRNAIAHHDRDEGRVSVIARIEGERLWMRVEDDGPGIDPAHAGQIFQALFQIGKRTDGSGMGLAIAQRHTIEVGGELVHQARAGRGAVFEIRWPLA